MRCCKKQTEDETRKVENCVNMITKVEGQTPLHLATIRSSIDSKRKKHYKDLVDIFLKYGADPELYDVRSWTAGDYCQDS